MDPMTIRQQYKCLGCEGRSFFIYFTINLITGAMMSITRICTNCGQETIQKLDEPENILEEVEDNETEMGNGKYNRMKSTS